MDLRWKHSHVVGPGHPREVEARSGVFFRLKGNDGRWPIKTIPLTSNKGFNGCTPRKFNSSPLKIGRNPKGKDGLLTIIFQGLC